MRTSQSGQYSQTAKLLHWMSAAIIVWATLSGLFAAASADPELRSWLSAFNISLTTLMIPVFAARVLHRLIAPKPTPAELPPGALRAARLGHAALYAMTGVVLASGVLMMEQDISVFDWVTISRPVENADLNSLFGLVHRFSSIGLGCLVIGHVAAVVLHERNGMHVLQRMLWSADEPACDALGHPLFCEGDIGAAHVTAHQLADAGRMADGYDFLKHWLQGRSGAGSEWVHIQFHMALFELAVDRWHDAYARFMTQVLPAIERGEDAATDAPALLWRLHLAAPEPVELPWQALRDAAIRQLGKTDDAYVELHGLLALAGAGDIQSLDRWIEGTPQFVEPVQTCLLRRMAFALRSHVKRTYRQALDTFDFVLPHLALIGGSREQNQLFIDIAEASRRPLANTAELADAA